MSSSTRYPLEGYIWTFFTLSEYPSCPYIVFWADGAYCYVSSQDYPDNTEVTPEVKSMLESRIKMFT